MNTFQENMNAKREFAKINRFKLVTAGGDGLFRITQYRKTMYKKTLKVNFITPEYEYTTWHVPQVIFEYGDHTKTFDFPRHTTLSNAEFVIRLLQESISWAAGVNVNPKSYALEDRIFTCYNEIIK